MTKVIKPLINLIFTAILLFAAVFIFGREAFGWFTPGNRVSGSGMSVTVSTNSVEIYAKINGADTVVGVSTPTADMPHIPSGVSGSIRPGSFGQFSFSVSDLNRTDFSFRYSLSVLNNEFAADGREGYTADAVEESKPLALNYINSHLMFFTSINQDGKYDGWIAPGSDNLQTVLSTDQNSSTVDIYWIWVAWYSDIFGSNAAQSPLSQNAKEQIAAFYAPESESSQRDKMFHPSYTGGTINQSTYSDIGFNEADYIVGINLQYICFSLNVWGG